MDDRAPGVGVMLSHLLAGVGNQPIQDDVEVDKQTYIFFIDSVLNLNRFSFLSMKFFSLFYLGTPICWFKNIFEG